MLSTQNISKIFKKYPKKWEKLKKSLPSPCPKEGTFDAIACEDMERRIKDPKQRDKSKKRQEKRELELKVLNLFENEGLHHRWNLREGVAILKREQVGVDKSIHHDPAGLFSTLSGAVAAPDKFLWRGNSSDDD